MHWNAEQLGWGTKTDPVNPGWNNLHVNVNSNNSQFSNTETDWRQWYPTALAKSGRVPFLTWVSKTLMHYKTWVRWKSLPLRLIIDKYKNISTFAINSMNISSVSGVTGVFFVGFFVGGGDFMIKRYMFPS